MNSDLEQNTNKKDLSSRDHQKKKKKEIKFSITVIINLWPGGLIRPTKESNPAQDLWLLTTAVFSLNNLFWN